jgi:hypothetical protein
MTATTAALLATSWGFPELDAPIAVIASGLDLVTAAFCATDPPPDPVLVPQDVIDAISLMLPGVAIPAQQKFTQWFLHRYWWNICGCIGSTTPPPPAMSNPNTPIGTGTGAPSGFNAPPCWTVTATTNIVSDNTFCHDIIGPWLPSGPGSTIVVGSNPPRTVGVLPAGATDFSWSFEALTQTQRMQLLYEQVDPSGNDVGHVILADSSIAGVQSGSFHLITPQNYPNATIRMCPFATFDGHFEGAWQGTFTIRCGGAPPNAIVGPCCPPDPLIDIKLDHLIGLVLNLYNRSSSGGGPPTSWVDGARHTSLEKAGSFLLAGPAIGVRVEMTTLPSGVTVNPGEPDFYWDSGFITPFSNDTPLRGSRLVFRDQSFQIPSVTDQIGYTLLHGTVVDIIELLPVA